MQILRKWLRLPASERRLTVQMALLLGMIHFGLKLFSLRRMRKILDWGLRAWPTSQGMDDHVLDRASWAVSAIGRRLPGLSNGPCLAQALAVQLLYQRQGLPAELYIGVARGTGSRLEAHAWVESAGHIVIGGPREELEQYTRLPALDGKLT